MLKGKFIVLNACIRKVERSKIHNLNLHFRILEKEECCKPKIRRKK